MTSNEINKLQSERTTLKARIEFSDFKSTDERTEAVKRLKEINKILNDWYLKK